MHYQICCLAGEEENNEKSTQNVEEMATRKFSELFHAISELCLQCDPSNRPGINQLLAHPFFKQCRKDTILSLFRHINIKPLNEQFLESQGKELNSKLQVYEKDIFQYSFNYFH